MKDRLLRAPRSVVAERREREGQAFPDARVWFVVRTRERLAYEQAERDKAVRLETEVVSQDVEAGTTKVRWTAKAGRKR